MSYCGIRPIVVKMAAIFLSGGLRKIFGAREIFWQRATGLSFGFVQG